MLGRESSLLPWVMRDMLGREPSLLPGVYTGIMPGREPLSLCVTGDHAGKRASLPVCNGEHAGKRASPYV